jgi:hypothetical protein
MGVGWVSSVGVDVSVISKLGAGAVVRGFGTSSDVGKV